MATAQPRHRRGRSPAGSCSRSVSSILLARQITRPVHRLVDATRQVSEGAYADVPVTSHDEIGELASAFGRMVEELREKDRLVAYFRTRGDMAAAAGRGRGRVARAGQRVRRPI